MHLEISFQLLEASVSDETGKTCGLKETSLLRNHRGTLVDVHSVVGNIAILLGNRWLTM